MSRFRESDRDLHFKYAIPFGLCFTILFVLGLATGLEYKDKLKGGVFDWKDWSWTVFGGLVGQILQCIIICLLVSLL